MGIYVVMTMNDERRPDPAYGSGLASAQWGCRSSSSMKKAPPSPSPDRVALRCALIAGAVVVCHGATLPGFRSSRVDVDRAPMGVAARVTVSAGDAVSSTLVHSALWRRRRGCRAAEQSDVCQLAKIASDRALPRSQRRTRFGSGNLAMTRRASSRFAVATRPLGDQLARERVTTTSGLLVEVQVFGGRVGGQRTGESGCGRRRKEKQSDSQSGKLGQANGRTDEGGRTGNGRRAMGRRRRPPTTTTTTTTESSLQRDRRWTDAANAGTVI